VLHRDIKPQNIVFQNNAAFDFDTLQLVDFGLSRKFLSSASKHIPYRDNKNLTGTSRYASLSVMLGVGNIHIQHNQVAVSLAIEIP
jgi:serine/threonine protein kinase